LEPRSPEINRHPLLLIALSQGGAVILVLTAYFALSQMQGASPDIQPIAIASGIGVIAGFVGLGLKLAKPWFALQLLLPLAVGGTLWLNIPSWAYLAAFFVLILVYWNSAGERVPLYLTNDRTREAITNLIPPDATTFADLGCGLGGVVLHVARRRPTMAVVGVESAPIPFVISWLRLKFARLANAEIRFQNFWSCNLAAFDMIYCFLSPVPMAELFRKAQDEMRPNSQFVSNSFPVPGIEPDHVSEVADRRCTQLYVLRIN
jgi:hypothetical protein